MVSQITIPGMFLSGDHASRPAADAVGTGSLYACSDHTKVYQSDGSSWSDWFDPTGLAGGFGLSTKGDIHTYDSADAALGVGTDGYALVADSGETTGLNWADVSASAPPAWTAYTPAWTSTGTAPAVVNGTIAGRYLILGKLCYFTIAYTRGSSDTNGTGNYLMSLPPGATARTTGGLVQVVAAYALDNTTSHYRGVGIINAAQTTIGGSYFNDGGSQWSATNPFTPATGDIFRWHGVIEID